MHNHLIPPQYLKEGPPSVGISIVDNWSPAHAIEDMDRNGVDVSILSFASPYLWFRSVDNGRRIARLCNDYSTPFVRDHPRRFGLLAGVRPLTDIDGTLHEIEYALDQRHAQGITVMTSYVYSVRDHGQGTSMGENKPDARILFQRASRRPVAARH